MKISVIQMNMRANDTEYNFAHAEELLKRAGENSDAVILPETWNTGFFPKDNIRSLADKNASRTKELFSRISKEYKTAVIGGSVTEERNGKIYNTCYIFNKAGECISSYSKTHLFSYMKEDCFYEKGGGTALFELNGIKAGVIICYDLRFPELARKLAASGAEILFVPCQWPAERTELMKTLIKGRAAENQMYSVLCNSCGEFGETVYGGHSLIADPLGEIISEAGENEEILSLEIDTEKVKALRHEFKVFSDLREDLYR